MRNQNKNKGAWLVCILIAVFVANSVVFAESEGVLDKATAKNAAIDEELAQYVRGRISTRFSEGKLTLGDLKKEMENEYKNFFESLDSSKEVEEKIKNLQESIADFTGQIKNIDLQLEETEKKINVIETQISKKKIDLDVLYEEQSNIQAESDAQKRVILEYFLFIQQEDVKKGSDAPERMARFFLADSSYSEYLRNDVYLSSWEQAERQIFHNIEGKLYASEEVTKLTNIERMGFEKLNDRLTEEKRNLSIQKTARNYLISQTRGEQDEYKKMWEESKLAMLQSAETIKSIKGEMEAINKKLLLLEQQKRIEMEKVNQNSKLSNNSQDETNTENPKESGEEQYEIGKIFANEDSKKSSLGWPVSPGKGVSAYFHDSGYVDQYGVSHEGLDIRCGQGTPVKAPALGYVYQVVDGGMGYSYVIIAHKNNITTVYGHLSKIEVKEGDMVQAGDVIGLSGGTPGTPGAGVMTSGAHLHFEVVDNGANQDPLEYLPIDQLPIQYIPEKFLKENVF